MLPHKINKRKIWISIALLITIGPMTHFLVTDIWNIYATSPDGTNLLGRAQRLLEFSEIRDLDTSN